MTDKEILVGKLTLFLRKHDALDSFKNGLSKNGIHAKNINDLAAFSIDIMRAPEDIIRRSFSWRDSDEGFGYWDSLCHKFYRDFNSLPSEDTDGELSQWANMWEE